MYVRDMSKYFVEMRVLGWGKALSVWYYQRLNNIIWLLNPPFLCLNKTIRKLFSWGRSLYLNRLFIQCEKQWLNKIRISVAEICFKKYSDRLIFIFKNLFFYIKFFKLPFRSGVSKFCKEHRAWVSIQASISFYIVWFLF